jgi:hypothetical protein
VGEKNGVFVVWCFYAQKNELKNKKNLDNRQKINLTLMHACFSSLTGGN